MKIAVSGKGGVGKTLVAAALANSFTKKGYEVLAIDADPSPNLALTLGISPEEASKIVPVSDKTELLKSKTRTNFDGVYRLSFSVDDIVEKFSIKSPYDVYLLVMGTVKSAGGGCTCPSNAVIRALVRHLFVERDEVVIMDMEAGVEHMGRGTAKSVDVILIVANPSVKSLEIAKKIFGLATETGIAKAFIVGNKVRNLTESELIQRFASSNKIPLLGLIPHDEHILEAELQGETPLKYAKNSEAIVTIQKMGEELLKRRSNSG